MSIVDTPQGFASFCEQISRDLSLALKGTLQLLFYICSKTNIEFDLSKRRPGSLADGPSSSKIDVDDFSDYVEKLADDTMRDLSRVTQYWYIYKGGSGKVEASKLLAKLRDFSEKDHDFAIFIESNVMPIDCFSRLLGIFSEVQALSHFIRQIRNRHAHPNYIGDRVGGQMYRLHVLTSCGCLLESYQEAFAICSLIEEPNGETGRPSPQWAKAKILYGYIRDIDSKLHYIKQQALVVDEDEESQGSDLVEMNKIDSTEPVLPEISKLISECSREILDGSAMLREQIENRINEVADDLKSSLLQPWRGMNIEQLLGRLLSDSQLPVTANHPTPRPHNEEENPGEGSKRRVDQEKIIANLLELRRWIRDELHRVDSSFEYYHCILMKPIVLAAVNAGAKTYQEFRMNPEFRRRILDQERKLLEQQEAYAAQITHLLQGGSLEDLGKQGSKQPTDASRTWFKAQVAESEDDIPF